LATNEGTKEVNVNPLQVIEIQKTADILSKTLEIDEKEVIKILSDKSDPWVPLKEVSLAKSKEIEKLPGIYTQPKLKRVYPLGEIASHVIGFCNKNNQGQYGIEQYWDKELRGKDGLKQGIVDAKGREIISSFNKIEKAEDGADLILTIDLNIQQTIEKALTDVVEKYKASGGTIIVSNPKTGEILGMASEANFNPNNYTEEFQKNKSIFINPAISIPYEPGSIFKPITMASAIEEGAVTPETTYIDSGQVKIGSYTIHNSDFKAHGTQTMTNVLEWSLNTGAIFAQQKLGSQKFTQYVEKFGFGKKTGIDLAGETSGSIYNLLHPLSNEKLIEYANASFGQGISATPIQVVTAFSAIANQGKMVKPHLVKKIIYPDGKEKETQTEILDEVISPETAARVSAMMVSVTKNGYGKKADIDGYLIATKTGTAQIPNPQGKGYLSGSTIQSFVGFAPAFDPQFLILLKLDRPQGAQFAESSLGPVFHDLTQYLFSYFGIPPEK